VFFSLFPGGSWTLGESIDLAPEASLFARGTTMRLEIIDRVEDIPLAQVLYPIGGLSIEACSEVSTDANTCSLKSHKEGAITFVAFDDLRHTVDISSDAVSLVEGGVPKVSYTPTMGIQL
jgi:hypothetical protein